MTGLQKWTWERLVTPANGGRRQREVIVAELSPSGLNEACKSIFEFVRNRDREGYRQFHTDHPVVWSITHGMKRSGYRYGAHFCDAHLPAEYRPADETAAGGEV